MPLTYVTKYITNMCINEYIICLALCLLIFLSVCAICCCCVFLKYRTGNYIACCLSESKICVIGQLHMLYKCKFIVRMFVWKGIYKKRKTKLQSETKNRSSVFLNQDQLAVFKCIFSCCTVCFKCLSIQMSSLCNQ